ncbi:hypothetical protein [Arthrobacter sp. YAF16]|uniref:hypothetical protein n=1 Tax=Arthrobacter sp. YAF16 TaxID=3233076 RepID=UPI003F9272D5
MTDHVSVWKYRLQHGSAHAGLALLFILAVMLMGPGVVWGDTVQYIRIADQLQGIPSDQAWLHAFTEFCKNPSVPYKGTLENCITKTVAGRGPVIGWVDRNPQYQAIFTPRVGFPLLSIPFMRLLGEREGMWLVAVAGTAIAGLLMARLARMAGLNLVPSLLVQAAFYALPASIPHGVALLAEGPTLASALVMAIGMAHVLRGSRGRGTALLVLGLGLVFFFKYSSAVLLCLSFLLVCVGLLIFKTYRRYSQIRLGIVIATVLIVTSLAVNGLFGFPGLNESLQDTFTDHFRHPPVDDPFSLLIVLEGDFLWRFLMDLPANAAYLLVFVVGVWGYVRAMREKLLPPAGWAGVALSLYGILSVVGHPVYTQAERLGSSLWVGVAIGIGLLARSVTDRVRQRKRSPQHLAGSGSPI